MQSKRMETGAQTMNDMAEGNKVTEVDVLVIGAGFSGACAGIRLLERGIDDFLIVDKADDVGGTWFWNRYPGAACDIPSHLYSFSFEPNPDWSRLYSGRVEIQAYVRRVFEKYGLMPKLRLGRELTKLTWDEATSRWTAIFGDGGEISARFVINGSGGLHKPAWPEIEGMADFQGLSMHTAEWDESAELSGKRICVIGSAASAVQAVPVLAESAANVTVFQRTPNYIAPRGDYHYDPARQARYRKQPWRMRLHRWLIFNRLELTLYPIVKYGKFRQRVAQAVTKNITKTVSNEAKQQALTPEYELGCKRILISDDYYQTLDRDDVELVTAGIAGIEPEGVRDRDGRLHEADVIIYATGFDLGGHMRSVEITGTGGRRLADDWADLAEAYQGVMVAGYPNYFTTTGPNTGVGTTSVVFMIEQTVGWIMRAMSHAGTCGVLDVQPEAQRRYNDRIQADLQKTVWASGCHSWYRREDGKIETLYPYNARTFRRQMGRLEKGDLIVRRAADERQGA